jgi:hypothetical protein
MVRKIGYSFLYFILALSFGCQDTEFEGSSGAKDKTKRGNGDAIGDGNGNDDGKTPNLGGGDSQDGGDGYVNDSFTVSETPGKVDILFFFDQSNSMSKFIGEVSQRLGAFIQKFSNDNSNIDYRLLVVAKTFNMPVQNDKVGITNIYIGNHGSIPTAKQLLKGEKSSGNIKLRKNSVKEIVVVTNDRANVGADQFAQWAKDNRREVGKVHVNGFVGFKESSFLGRLGSCFVDHAGADYIAMGNHPDLGGLIQDICSPSWDNLMNKLGEKISANTTSVFTLSQKPTNAEDLEVEVSGKKLSPDDYEYDEKDNSVEIFIDLSRTDVVKIGYDGI